MLEKQNTFSRVLSNEGKMGAYYTDLEHCLDIRKMFHFPDNEEVSCLEPSIGDATAVIAVTAAEENPNIKIFGVELNNETAKKVQQNPYVEDILEADFLNDVYITNNAFSFCFGNPPYLANATDDGKRSEFAFLEKIGNYLCNGAILVWVIPYYIFSEIDYLRYWHTRYDTLALYRFRDAEYAKYKQIVIVGRKKRLSSTLSLSQIKEYASQVASIEKIPVLPSSFDETIDVLPSPSENVKTFARRNFDANAALNAISSLPADILKAFDEHMSVRPYSICNIGRPPIPLKKDSMYLLATSGGGQGLTGSEEDGTLHLQRGTAEVIAENCVEVHKEGSNSTAQIRETTRTQVSMYVVQNNGQISKLV